MTEMMRKENLCFRDHEELKQATQFLHENGNVDMQCFYQRQVFLDVFLGVFLIEKAILAVIIHTL